MAGFIVPEFATETEEVLWWESNEDALLDEFEKATAEGRVGIGTVANWAALAGAPSLRKTSQP
jgi:hypothetical protein